jgi:hypothetical protein
VENFPASLVDGKGGIGGIGGSEESQDFSAKHKYLRLAYQDWQEPKMGQFEIGGLPSGSA